MEKTTSTNNHKSQQAELLLWGTAGSSEIPALPVSGLSAALHGMGMAGWDRVGFLLPGRVKVSDLCSHMYVSEIQMFRKNLQEFSQMKFLTSGS